jgi:dTDP-4-dehydrorhamnose 3,5-epimerase
MIDGVHTKKLHVIPDERGFLMEILRNDDEFFEKFGQVYMTSAYPGVVKGWHYHRLQTDYLTCVHGMIKLALYDARDNSPTKGEIQEFFIGERNPMLVSIPPGVLHGFKGIGTETALIVNTVTESYNYAGPDEFRVAWDSPDVPYDWALKNG